jgi:hypothetical protein
MGGIVSKTLREDLCERCDGKAWVSESKLSEAPPIRIGPCKSCNADGAIPPPIPAMLAGGQAEREHEPAKVNVPGRRVIEDDGTEGNMVVAGSYSREQEWEDADPDSMQWGLPDGERLYRCESCGGLLSAVAQIAPTCAGCDEEMGVVSWPPRSEPAEVLAKALDQFFHEIESASRRGPNEFHRRHALADEHLREQTRPTLQALGYPKEETP